MKIGIIGAGNIGTAMAALIGQSDAQVYVAARGDRLKSIQKDGVLLLDRGNRCAASPTAATRIEQTMDAVFVCVKSQSLARAIVENRAAIDPDTLVIPMVNGLPFWFNATSETIGSVPYLDPDGDLQSMLSPHQILGAVLLMTVRMEQGCAISSNTPTLSLGSVITQPMNDKVERLLTLLEASGIRTDLAGNIREKVLVKLLANIATNPLSAISGATLEQIGMVEPLRAIACQIADEFRAWAAQSGFDLPSNQWLIDLFIDAGDFPTSMLQDARAGRPLEIDAICRAPLAITGAIGLPMPCLARIIDQIENAPALPLTDPSAVLDQTLNVSEFS